MRAVVIHSSNLLLLSLRRGSLDERGAVKQGRMYEVKSFCWVTPEMENLTMIPDLWKCDRECSTANHVVSSLS